MTDRVAVLRKTVGPWSGGTPVRVMARADVPPMPEKKVLQGMTPEEWESQNPGHVLVKTQFDDEPFWVDGRDIVLRRPRS